MKLLHIIPDLESNFKCLLINQVIEMSHINKLLHRTYFLSYNARMFYFL